MKDWKLIASGKYGEAYENQETKDRLEVVYKPKIKFVQVMEDSGYVLYEREFKTKKQAITYAKKTMQTH